MAVFTYPLSLPRAHAGVTRRDFQHYSPAHGAGHVNRVIFFALFIARFSGYRNLIPAAWAAAHIHDLARRGDGICREHGRWAVDHVLPLRLPLLRAGGVQWDDLPGICTAVGTHCLDAELPPSHPHATLTAILKDADALDRARFGDLDAKRLRLQRSQEIAPLAEKLFAATSADASLEDVWTAADRLLAPPPGLLESHPYRWNPAEPAAQRRARRLTEARAYQNTPEPSPRIWSDKISAEEAIFASCQLALAEPQAGALRDVAQHLAPRIPHAVPIARATALRLLPYTATRSLAAFTREGVYRGFWEAGASWHKEWVDDPESTRLVHCLRLFGERDAHVGYGVLLDPQSPEHESNLANLRSVYGPDLIRWEPSILDSATFTLNDSQKAPRVLPFSREAFVKATVLNGMARAAGKSWPKEIMPWPDLHPYYWEFQTHELLLSGRVVETIPAPLAAAA